MLLLAGLDTIEEFNDASVQRVLGTDHEEAIVPDQLLENIRAMSQMVHRNADVGPNSLPHQRSQVVRRSVFSNPSTEGRTRSTIERRLRDWFSTGC